MIQFKAKSLELLVTPNHRMVADHKGNNKRIFVEAKNFKPSQHYIPQGGVWEGKEVKYFILPPLIISEGKGSEYNNVCTKENYGRERLKIKMDDWLKFLGLWLTKGLIDKDRIIITQVNQQKREKVKELLRLLPFNYREEGPYLIIYNKQARDYLTTLGDKYSKFIPKEIKNLSRRQLKILFDWMMKGESSYRTSSKRLADDLQEVILKLGGMGTLKISKIKGKRMKEEIVYEVGVQKTKHYIFRKKAIKEIDYKGKVYCCEVKNHTLFVRRNGKISWCGNSIGVVTINMPRLGFLSKDEDEFFKRLSKLMELAKESLEIKRKILERFTENNLYPYMKFYLRNVKKRFNQYWKNHFSTIGLVGMNEACLNLLGGDIATDRGRRFALKVLDFMRKKLIDFQIETGNNYNLEATPAEGASYRLAKIDKEKIPSIICANEEEFRKGASPFYTNSTHLPVNYTDDIFEVLEHQDDLQIKYTGGAVLHIYLGEKIENTEAVKSLIKKICSNYRIPYFTLTPTFSICSCCGYLPNETPICPRCGSKCEVYSRIVGYLRPIFQWNEGKQAEFRLRKNFKIII
ncbi:MAG TPA: hypothetical protein EYP89_01235 [Candidatus Omnitrophica bacterium]|nr:hypothetical protein [Candidatus Omnitrophota bacterium]